MGKYKSRATKFAEALSQIESGVSEANSIKEELENWRDGLQGTNLEGSTLYQNLDEAIETIDNAISEIEALIPDLQGVEIPRGFRG